MAQDLIPTRGPPCLEAGPRDGKVTLAKATRKPSTQERELQRQTTQVTRNKGAREESSQPHEPAKEDALKSVFLRALAEAGDEDSAREPRQRGGGGADRLGPGGGHVPD